jgi:hypothetical protein
MNLSRKILAGAVIALLPLTGAMACTTSAWSTTTGAPVADDPDTSAATNATETASVKRYSGNCGLAPASGAASHVTNNTVADAIYRARFYVFTGLATGNPQAFEAYTGEDGGGTSVFSVTYDRANNELDFTAAGTTVPSVPVVAGKWYSVELFHNSGNPLSISVEGNNAAVAAGTPATVASAAAVTGTVQSVRLGNLNGSALTFGGAPGANNSFGFFRG